MEPDIAATKAKIIEDINKYLDEKLAEGTGRNEMRILTTVIAPGLAHGTGRKENQSKIQEIRIPVIPPRLAQGTSRGESSRRCRPAGAGRS